jgi:hypothetical protein
MFKKMLLGLPQESAPRFHQGIWRNLGGVRSIATGSKFSVLHATD